MVAERQVRDLHQFPGMEPIYWLIAAATIVAVFTYTYRRKRRARQ
jgi:hypothetical protein